MKRAPPKSRKPVTRWSSKQVRHKASTNSSEPRLTGRKDPAVHVSLSSLFSCQRARETLTAAIRRNLPSTQRNAPPGDAERPKKTGFPIGREGNLPPIRFESKALETKPLDRPRRARGRLYRFAAFGLSTLPWRFFSHPRRPTPTFGQCRLVAPH